WDADAVPGLVRRPPDPFVGPLVLGVRAVAQVEAGDVHTGLDELQDALGRGRRRAERADDLCATHVTKPYSWKTSGTAGRPTPRDTGLITSAGTDRPARRRSAGTARAAGPP